MSTHAFDSWAQSQRADGYAEGTIRVRKAAVLRAAAHAHTEPEDLVPEHITAWLATPMAPATRAAYRAHLTVWGAWLGRPLTATIRRVPLPPAQPDPLPEPDLMRLLDYLRELPRTTAWVLLGAYAGFRASETARISGRDLRGDSVRILGKGGRVDVLPIPPILQRALAPYAGTNGPLWPGITGRQVSAHVAYRAGKLQIRAFRYHRLRHRYGTQTYRVTRDILVTQRLMRHQSPRTTAGYAAIGDDAARHIVNQLPGAAGD
jgi:hypothetical protein